MNIVFSDFVGSEYSKEVMRLLLQCDKEFVPSLSSRGSIYQTYLKAKSFSLKPRIKRIAPYFEELKSQSAILAMYNGEVVGVLAYKVGYSSDIIPKEDNIYVSLSVISKKFRRRGMSRALFESLFNKYPKHSIYIRTWSTNNGQVSLLQKLSFIEYKRVPNDRGCGIDTIYFYRRPNDRFI